MLAKLSYTVSCGLTLYYENKPRRSLPLSSQTKPGFVALSVETFVSTKNWMYMLHILTTKKI